MTADYLNKHHRPSHVAAYSGKLKAQPRGTSLQDLVPASGQGADHNDLASQPESGNEKKIEQLAEELGEQTPPTLPCPISEHLQVINEEDLAAILPDVGSSGGVNVSLEGFVSLNIRNNDSPSTLIESLGGPYDDVTLTSQHDEISVEAGEAEDSAKTTHSSPSTPPTQSPDQTQTQLDTSYLAPTTDHSAENLSIPTDTPHSDVISPPTDSWLLKPSAGYECSYLPTEAQSPEQKSPEVTPCRSLRSGAKRRQSQNQESGALSGDGENSVKIDCSVSHISLDSGFGGSPSYTSSPTSAYLYSPISVENKSPSSTYRSGARTMHESSFKRSQLSPEPTDKDAFQDSLSRTEVPRHSKRKSGRNKKKPAPRESDICSLVERLISIEERSKKVVKKSPQRERIKKVRRWLKLEKKKKLKKAATDDLNITTDIDRLITKFSSFTIVEKNPHLTRASNHIIKSKFRCKCCADNDSEKQFSKNRRKKSNGQRGTSCSGKGAAKHSLSANRKKTKRQIDIRNEKCERRLPLKKRYYRVPMNSQAKIDSAATRTPPADAIEPETSFPLIEVPEQNEESYLDVSLEDSDAKNITPVTPKKRFHMECSVTMDSKDNSQPSRSDSECDDCMSSQIQSQMNTSKQTVSAKSKISDEICKKMKSVSLLPSNDLKNSNDSLKDLKKVSKRCRNVSPDVHSSSRESKAGLSQHVTKDLRNSGIERNGIKALEESGKGPIAEACTIPSVSERVAQSVSVTEPGASHDFETKDRKKRRRTINRTGFPTKKKKKKHNASVSVNVNYPIAQAGCETKPSVVCLGGHRASYVSTTCDLEPITESLMDLSCPEGNDSVRINSFPHEPSSLEENTSMKSSEIPQPEGAELVSQSRRVTLRARPRQINPCSPEEVERKNCDREAKLKKRLRDFKLSMEHSKRVIAEKKYLEAGLFSSLFKVGVCQVESLEEDVSESDECPLPSLTYYAKRVRQKVDFTLPYDIWVSHRKSKTFFRIKSNRLSKDCDYYGSSSDGSETNESSEISNDNTAPSFSLFLPDKRYAIDGDSETSDTLTEEQARFIRANSCFLVRNLIKVRRTLATGNKGSSCADDSLELKIQPSAANKKLEKLLQFLKSFQNSTSEPKNKDLYTDPSFAPKESSENLVSTEEPTFSVVNNECNTSMQSAQHRNSVSSSERKLFSGSNANKSVSRISQPAASETLMKTGVHQAENSQKYFKMLVSGTCKIQTGKNFYITKDSSELELDETVGSPIFGRSDCNVFHVERLWRDENNDGYAFGHYYLRPHETFHEPSRRFFPNELMKSPLCETIPISRIVDLCHVLNPSAYCKGKPAGADLQHVFICEYRVDKGAKTFSRIPKRKACFSFDETLELHQYPLKPVRDFKPYDVTRNFKSEKKRNKPLRHPAAEITNGLTKSTSMVDLSTEMIEEPNQQHRLNSIIFKLSEKADYTC